jgi:hypothetical protein
MTTPSKIRKGFFILADISGYTSFVSGTELEHAQEIVEELTKLMIRHIQAPLKLVKLEGDAVLYYTPAEMLPDAERLVEHIESTYYDFASHLQNMQHRTNCPCRACTSMHMLDLNFFVHYGEYLIQKLPGTAEDIAGRDVILLHRLMKNTVTENLGLRGYALLTRACLERIGPIAGVIPHNETYEHIGEVECGVYNLRAYEQAMRETRRVYIEPQDADYIYERVVHTSPELLWSYIIEPTKRLKWQAIRKVINKHNTSGRLGIDAEFHCDHGSFSRTTHMVDWRPFHYMSNISVQKFNGIPWSAPACQGMFEFIPVDEERTRLSFRARSVKRDWFTMLLVRMFMKRSMDKEYNTDFDRLDKLLSEMPDEEC